MNDNNRQVTAAHVGGAAGSGLPGMPNRSYVFDNMGNRTSAVKDGVTTGYTPNSVNAYAAVGGVNRSHDLNGNLTNDGTKIYTWEQHDRLTTVTSGGSVVGAYSYDAFGRRTSRRWTDPATGLTRTTRYVYDGWNVVAEHSTAPFDPNGPVTLQRRYVWGQDLSGTMQGAGGVGGLLMIEDRTTGTPQAHYVCHDGNGNVIKLITQDSGGNNVISAAYTYDPFGNVRTATGPYASTNPVRFSTKFQDPETGWNYYGYRYYDAANGRWRSRDPMAERASKNLFAFLDNNQVGQVDILGLIRPDRLEEIQRGTGKPYDESKNPDDYNCAGLACGKYKNMTEEETDNELSKLKEIDCNTPCCKKTVKWTFTKQQRTVDRKTGETLDEKDPSDDWHVSSKATDGQYYHKYGAGPVMGAYGEDDFKPGFDLPTCTGNIHSRQKVIKIKTKKCFCGD